ncbi:MAG: FecR domain-containing protein [Prolixibacteraceae bacterium]|nr:FecR domain-containing protein [Prolixibacteraceae bacterium]
MPDIKVITERYLQGVLSSGDEKILLQWIKENPENSKLIFREKDIWDSTQLASPGIEAVTSTQWQHLQDKIKTRTIRVNEFLRYVAIFIIALASGFWGHSVFFTEKAENQQVEYKEVEATKGQVKEIFLADGTHVWLNSDSKLSFPSDFSGDNRKIELRGEAFFEVTADADKKFLVKTGNHTVEVTGTRFNVCEYPESKIIETTLESGSVKILTGNIINDLMPGQKSGYNTETAEIKIGEAVLDINTSWKEGYYECKNEPLPKVFKIIERWWDVKIYYPEDKFEDERITGIIRKHKSLEHHFNVISKLVKFDYVIEPDKITVIVQD